MDRVKGLDLYALLEVEVEADEKTIRKAYRKKALTCHPDKNPDNKEAADLFHQLSDALEVLTDESTRRAYDNVLKARKANELKNRQLDSKRRKLKEELEEREKNSKFQEIYDKKTEEEKLAREIERLRKEGSKRLQEEQELMRKQIAEEEAKRTSAKAAPTAQSATAPARIKVKWSHSSDSPYNRESLEKIFNKYGTVSGVVVNEKKGGSALVEFQDLSCAKMAVKIETGFFNQPLKIKPLFDETVTVSGLGSTKSNNSAEQNSSQTRTDTDFESLVLRKLRQEEERKRLIAQIMAEEAD
eukprot:TRINITY_DN12408_c0_g1_i1.p1 TRINITY_DN12408_c0_g1~~TRINITY_DN12408_c0_g1_i1.p1  ORF type:complete len:300 (+),score=55.89 TRINITY_DN12408_c0_g1_i1:72-971(+)